MILPSIPGVLEIEGQEGWSVPLVFDSPHSGVTYPNDFRHIADPARLRMAEDTHVEALFGDAPAAGAVLLHAHFPRAYVDTNRAADDMDPAEIDGDYPTPLRPGVKSGLGIGLCWTRVPPDGEPMYAHRLAADEVVHRIERYHRPYQETLRALIDAAHGRWGAAWHINCHSMPHLASAMSTEPKGTPRADFVLGDRDGTTCAPQFTQTVRDFIAARGYGVAINDPYKGVELVRANGDPAAGRHSLQVEVNRHLYMDEATCVRNAGFEEIRETLAALANHLAAWTAAQVEETA